MLQPAEPFFTSNKITNFVLNFLNCVILTSLWRFFVKYGKILQNFALTPEVRDPVKSADFGPRVLKFGENVRSIQVLKVIKS